MKRKMLCLGITAFICYSPSANGVDENSLYPDMIDGIQSNADCIEILPLYETSYIRCVFTNNEQILDINKYLKPVQWSRDLKRNTDLLVVRWLTEGEVVLVCKIGERDTIHYRHPERELSADGYLVVSVTEDIASLLGKRGTNRKTIIRGSPIMRRDSLESYIGVLKNLKEESVGSGVNYETNIVYDGKVRVFFTTKSDNFNAEEKFIKTIKEELKKQDWNADRIEIEFEDQRRFAIDIKGNNDQ